MGGLLMASTAGARLAARNASQKEGDFICSMVLELVRGLAHDQGCRPDPIKGVEPTGIAVATEMRPFVEQRSTGRVPEGGRMPRRKAS